MRVAKASTVGSGLKPGMMGFKKANAKDAKSGRT